jgi:hypothetical protein
MRQWLSSLSALLLLSLVLVARPLGAAPVIGAIDPHVTQANIHQTICVAGYSRHVRPPTSYTRRIKRVLMAESALGGPPNAYELDHVIPLDLAGAPRDPANLQLQPWAGPDGARAKDRIETALHRAVCAGHISLSDAQQCMMQDWHTCTAQLSRKER